MGLTPLIVQVGDLDRSKKYKTAELELGFLYGSIPFYRFPPTMRNRASIPHLIGDVLTIK